MDGGGGRSPSTDCVTSHLCRGASTQSLVPYPSGNHFSRKRAGQESVVSFSSHAVLLLVPVVELIEMLVPGG